MKRAYYERGCVQIEGDFGRPWRNDGERYGRLSIPLPLQGQIVRCVDYGIQRRDVHADPE